jgi:nucleotide-binding universal stress UspA family protein
VVAGILCLGVIVTMAPGSRVAGLGLVAASLVWYVVWVRRKAKVVGEFGPHWQRERPLEGVIEAAQEVGRAEKHEILLPVLPDTRTGPLMEVAAALTRADERRVIVALDVVVVPSQTPLESVEARWKRQRSQETDTELGRLARQGAELSVPVRPLRRAAHGQASGVLGVAEARSATELILLDWRGPLSAGQIYGSPRKTILQEAHCHVAVLRERNLGEVRRVLVPAGGGPHARLGLRLAAQIARSDDAELTVLRIARPSQELNMEAEERACTHMADEVLGTRDSRVQTKVVVHEAVVDGILEETEGGEYDLLVIGASDEWGVKSLLVGAIPDAIADKAPCSVLMVRRYEPTGISTFRRMVHTLGGW